MLRINKSSIPRENIDRVHRIGRTYTDKNTGKKVKSTIVKFNSWESRQQFYYAWPKHFNNCKRKPGQHLFSLSVDLTSRWYLLLIKAKGLIKDLESINYVFADINCSFGMKFKNGVFKYFNSENELHCLINNWIIRSSHSNIYILQLFEELCLFFVFR